MFFQYDLVYITDRTGDKHPKEVAKRLMTNKTGQVAIELTTNEVIERYVKIDILSLIWLRSMYYYCNLSKHFQYIYFKSGVER